MIRLLLVDDDKSFLEALSSGLKKDFQVSTAIGVADAKQILVSKAVDAVCSDFNMRDGTGLELLEWLRKKEDTTPFLLLSCTEDTILTNAVSSYGATFCSKTDCNLIERIKSVVISPIMQNLLGDGRRKPLYLFAQKQEHPTLTHAGGYSGNSIDRSCDFRSEPDIETRRRELNQI